MSDVKRLTPLAQHWPQFCKKFPELALMGTPNSLLWFQRMHGKTLIEAGAIVRATGRRLLVTDTFDQATYALLTVGKLPEKQQ